MQTHEKVGIYIGTFDPVHSGDVSFALQASAEADLDSVYFMPDRVPVAATGEHYAHRVAMLSRAIRPHETLGVLEMVDKRFALHYSLPRLNRIFPGAKITLLMGAYEFIELMTCDVSRVLRSTEIVVAVRNQTEISAVTQAIAVKGLPPRSVTMIDSLYPDVTSAKVRGALRLNIATKGLLTSVRAYARREWLYARMP
jgi:nicotinic acid mononucleotide adenylyltransferase